MAGGGGPRRGGEEVGGGLWGEGTHGERGKGEGCRAEKGGAGGGGGTRAGGRRGGAFSRKGGGGGGEKSHGGKGWPGGEPPWAEPSSCTTSTGRNVDDICPARSPLRSGRADEERRCSCGSTFARPGTRSPIRPASSPATATASAAGRRPRPAGVQRVRRVRGPGEPGRRRPRVPARGVRRRRDRRPADDPHRAPAAVYDKRPFSTEGLSVQAKGGLHSERSVWRFGLPTANLGGTARTLDDVDGAGPAGARSALPRRRHLLRRLPHGAARPTTAGSRRADRHARPLRLRLRPRLPRRAARPLPL